MNILVLNGLDIPDPEVFAMFQALYSRDPRPVAERLAELGEGDLATRQQRLKDKINRYYVEYGHDSIGDCGYATVFIENVSMLAAKVIQDDPLYVGQECSTRYLDFSKQPIVTSSDSSEELRIVERWRTMYIEVLPALRSWAARTYSMEQVLSPKIKAEDRESVYAKTCNAIAFDVARGLLPCGSATSVAWTGNLRRLRDRCVEMAYHPLQEVREIGRKVYRHLQIKHPNSFAAIAPNEDDEVRDIDHYYEHAPEFKDYGMFVHTHNNVLVSAWAPDAQGSETWQDLLRRKSAVSQLSRMRGAADDLAYFGIRGALDFGSFRDVQRHRNGHNKLPLVGQSLGPLRLWNEFYTGIFDEVSPDVLMRAAQLYDRINSLSLSTADAQYLYPMMTNVSTSHHWSLGQVRYVSGLRTRTSVHPTARRYIHGIRDHLISLMPEMEVMLPATHAPDYEASDRGNQTIKTR